MFAYNLSSWDLTTVNNPWIIIIIQTKQFCICSAIVLSKGREDYMQFLWIHAAKAIWESQLNIKLIFFLMENSKITCCCFQYSSWNWIVFMIMTFSFYFLKIRLEKAFLCVECNIFSYDWITYPFLENINEIRFA